MRGLLSIISFFLNKFVKFNNTGARMLISIIISYNKKIKIGRILSYICDVITYVNT